MSRTPAPSVLYIVDGSVDVTGAFICARNMARVLAGTADVAIVLPKESRISANELQDFSAVHLLPLKNLRRSVQALAAYVPALLVSSWKLRRLLARDGATRLVLNDFYFLQGLVCRILGFRGRVVTWVRIDPRLFGTFLSRLWIRLIALSSHALVAVSQHIRSCLPPGVRSSVLYDTLSRPPLDALPVPASSERRLVCVGNYIPGKGQDHAIEAFSLVAADFPELTLHFHGGDMGRPGNRAHEARLRARVKHHRLEGRVHFHGFAPDPRLVLHDAFASLNFSDHESFSLTVLEASAGGVPVIATRSGGPAEIIEHGVTGVLVPRGDIAAMADGIRCLASDPALAAAMGRAGRELVARRFSPDSYRQGLLSILHITEKVGQ